MFGEKQVYQVQSRGLGYLATKRMVQLNEVEETRKLNVSVCRLEKEKFMSATK